MDTGSKPSNDYIFNRDYKSSVRLNLNHWLMKGLMGYLIHPKVQYPKNAVIADVGTGTGIWLQELAEQMPSPATFCGFDNSPEQYPAPEWRLPNVTLETHDCFQPFPEEHLGKYDLVQIRFFRCIVKNNDPEPLLKNVATLLKPGGYLQWVDMLASKAHVETKNPNAKTTATEQLAKMSLRPTAELPADWVGELPHTFERHDFEVCASDEIPFRDAYRLAWAQSMLAGIEDMSGNGSEEQKKQAHGWMGALSEEIAQGVVMVHPAICVVGRKKT